MACAAIIVAVVFMSALDWLFGRRGLKAAQRENEQAWLLVRAADSGDLHTVTSLLHHGADVNGHGPEGNTALCAAAARGRKAIVRLLIEKGADVNAANHAQWTPLLLAVSRGAYDVAEYLLDHGADARAALSDGWMAIHSVCKEGEMGVLKMLLSHGVKCWGKKALSPNSAGHGTTGSPAVNCTT
jgi:ankyrin repeat protein